MAKRIVDEGKCFGFNPLMTYALLEHRKKREKDDKFHFNKSWETMKKFWDF